MKVLLKEEANEEVKREMNEEVKIVDEKVNKKMIMNNKIMKNE